jgi:hypothetical protein
VISERGNSKDPALPHFLFLLHLLFLLHQNGEIEMEICWAYEQGFESVGYVGRGGKKMGMPQLTALQQLQQNSLETNLKLGNVSKVRKQAAAAPTTYNHCPPIYTDTTRLFCCRHCLQVLHMLDCFPLVFDVGRVCIRDLDFYLADLFAGRHGTKAATDMQSIYIKHLECRDAKKGGAFMLDATQRVRGGMTLKVSPCPCPCISYLPRPPVNSSTATLSTLSQRPLLCCCRKEFLMRFWLKGILPEALSKASVIRSAMSSVVVGGLTGSAAEMVKDGVSGFYRFFTGKTHIASHTVEGLDNATKRILRQSHVLFGRQNSVKGPGQSVNRERLLAAIVVQVRLLTEKKTSYADSAWGSSVVPDQLILLLR